MFDVYRSCNIGLFMKCNDRFLLIPSTLARTKAEKISSFVKVPYIGTSVDGMRILGPLITMNSNGILVSKYISDEELNKLRTDTNVIVERFPSNFNAIGNLVVANDYGAIASTLLSTPQIKLIGDLLDVPVERMNIAGYNTIGAVIFSTNIGALVHPLASEKEVKQIASILKTDVTPCTVNGGVPFISSGVLGNSKGLVVGTLTNGTELMNISTAFNK